MKDSSHKVFIIFLAFVGALAVITLTVVGWEYYATPLVDRAFRTDYASMRPSGSYSHGLGIVGSTLIIVGVSMYSTRKRVRILAQLGKLSRWLEVHIFLCLLGPILVIYHTTFKVGGIAAITFWTMISVASSGIVGRFLYTQIPRNLNGVELTLEEINDRIRNAGSLLRQTPIGERLMNTIDGIFSGIQKPTGFTGTFSTLIRLQQVKAHVRFATSHLLKKCALPPSITTQLRVAATERATLLQKSVALSQVQQLFYYWHAIHLPFTVIMFITLVLHVTVTMLLGYRWIF